MIHLLVTAVASCAVVFALFALVRYALRARRLDALLARVPKPADALWLPYIGVGTELARGAPWATFARWAAACGGTFAMTVLGRRVLYTTQPLLIKRILLTRERAYPKDLDFSYAEFLCLLGKGLVTAEGERWRKSRLLLSHAFRIDILHDVPRITAAACARLFAHLDDAEATTAGGAVGVDLGEALRLLTLQVISEAVLGLPPAESDRVFGRLYLPVVEECNRRVWAPWRRFVPFLRGNRTHRACLASLHSYLTALVERRWAERQARVGSPTTGAPPPPRDLFDLILDNIPVDAFTPATVVELRDSIATLLLAGHETSASMLTWAIYAVLRMRPDVLAELRREHEKVFGTAPPSAATAAAMPPFEQIRGMQWAPAVLRETLRLFSVVPLVVRVAAEDDAVPAAESGLPFDLTIPRGAVVMVGIDALHRRADVWPDPEAFRPERFFDMAAVDPYAFLPFINGPRNCLGQHLSLLESCVVLSHVLYAYDFTLVKGGAGEPPLARHPFIVPLAPEDGLMVRPRRRVF